MNGLVENHFPRRRLLLLSVAFTICCLGLHLALSLSAGRGEPLLPLDDVYIHFQYARQLALGQPNVYNPGQPPTSGATSFLYPFLLALGYGLGFKGMWLGLWALLLGGLAQALTLIACVYWADLWRVKTPRIALLLIALALSGSLTWHFYSGMETGLLIAALAWLLVSIQKKSQPMFVLAGSAATLLRPEGGVLVAIAVLIAFWHMRPHTHRSSLLALPVLLWFVQPLLNWLLTGTLVASGNQSKSLLGMVPFDWMVVGSRIIENIVRAWGELLSGSGQGGTWYYPPFAGILAMLFLFLTLRNRERRAVALLLLLWGAALIPLIATLDTAFWHFKRYQMPFLFFLTPVIFLAMPSVRISRIRWLPEAFGIGFATVSGLIAYDFASAYALNISYVYAQPRQMAAWLNENTEADAIVAVHDVGLMRYAGERTTLDMVGLTTPEAAHYWRNGPGSVAEFLLLKRPDYIAAYGIGHQVGLRMLADTRLYQHPLAAFSLSFDPRINVALAAGSQAIYQPDWSQIEAQRFPAHSFYTQYLDEFRIMDELNPADIVSERNHDYVWLSGNLQGFASEPRDLPYWHCRDANCRMLDGVRLIDREERFVLRGAESGEDVLLISRVHASHAASLDIYVDGALIGTRVVPEQPGYWIEVATLIPAQYARPEMIIRIVPQMVQGTYQPAYHWAYAGIYPVSASIAPQEALAVYQEGALQLIDYRFLGDGSQMRLHLDWESSGVASGDYRLFIHVYDDLQRPPLAQLDTYLGAGQIPLGNLLPGRIQDDFVVDLSELRPGVYRLVLGFYQPSTEERLMPQSERLAILPDGRLILDDRIEVLGDGR